MAATITPSSFGPNGGAGSITISTARDCTWFVNSEADWVSIADQKEGQGSAVVPYAVEENLVPVARSAALNVGDQRVQLSQAPAPCQFELSHTAGAIGSAGGSLSVNVTTTTGCSWTAVPSDAWITIASGQSGSATGTVVLTVAPNTGQTRIGRANIAGQTYTVTQDAAPAPTPAPVPPSPPAPGPPAPPPPSSEIHVSGKVSGISGKCPTVTFSAGGRTIATSSATDYDEGKCSDLSNGDDLSIDGRLRSNGVVDATDIEFKKNR